MRAISALSAAVLTASVAVAQCPFSSVSVSSYGQGCNPAFGDFNLPTMSASLDATHCTLDLTVDAMGGCCNVYLLGRMYVIGFQQLAVPLPFGTCTLLASPDVVLYVPSQVTAPVSIPLAAGLPPMTLYAQSGALYLTTIGLSYDFAFGAGAQLDLQ